jgi:hypothetical protein
MQEIFARIRRDHGKAGAARANRARQESMDRREDLRLA